MESEVKSGFRKVKTGSEVPNLVQYALTGIAEETEFQSAYVEDSFIFPWNPDDLWQKNGDYSIYEDMLKDDQVSVALNLKKDLTLGSGWSIIQGEDGQEEIVQEIEKALKKDLYQCFDDVLDEIISAYEFGFSGSEKIYQKQEDGKITLKSIKTRHPNTWLIHQDKHGNIEKFEQQGASDNVFLKPSSVLHFVNQPKYSNPYGRSDLRACYAAWFVKRQIIRYYAIFLEKAASPTPIGKYPKGTNPNDVDDLFSTIKKFQAKTAMVIPEEIEVEFLEASSNGEAYTKGINIFNMFIGRALVIPDLLGFQGSETSGGSHSLGRDQMGVFFKHIGRRRKRLEDLVNKEIIGPMLDFNYGEMDNPPRFQFNQLEEDDIIEFSKAWIEAIRANAFKPTIEEVNHFRSLIKYPESDEGIEEMPELEPETPDMGPMPEDDDTPEPVEAEEEVEEEVEPQEMKGDKEKDEFKLKPTEGPYANKVNFKKLETQLEAADNALMSEAQPVIKDIYEDLYKQMEKKKIIEKQNVKAAGSLKIKPKLLEKMNKLLDDSMLDNYSKHKGIAATELMRSEFAAPLPDDKFLKAIESENFEMIGDWEYNITKAARVEMIAAIKDGRSLSSVIDILDESGKKAANIALQRYARTKFTETMNRARVDYFSDSRVVSGYQYSAIMDGATTAICSGLHGKKFKAGSEPIPPMHFNCRSVLVPITMFEEFKPTEKIRGQSPDAFIEENKGKGFSKR